MDGAEFEDVIKASSQKTLEAEKKARERGLTWQAKTIASNAGLREVLYEKRLVN